MAIKYVNTPVGETVNVRASASTSAAIKFRLGRGTQVTATYYNSLWDSISCSSGSGYVMSEFLSTTNPNGSGSGGIGDGVSVGQTLQLTATSVNVRSTPPSGTVLWQANTPETYSVKAKQTVSGYVWYQIQKNAQLGWLRGDFVKLYTGGTTPNPSLPSDVTGSKTAGFVDTKSDPLSLRPNMGSGTAVNIPRHASVYYYTTTNPDYYYVEYGSNKGYAASQYIMKGTWVEYTGSDPIEKIKAYSKSYKYSTKHIKASTYLANLDTWARKTNYGYPSNHNNAGHYPSENPPKICCGYMPYLSRNSLGYNNVPNQKSTSGGALIGGTVSSLGGLNKLLPGMELFQGTTHMGVFAGAKTFPNLGSQYAVYQSVAGALGNVTQMYTPDTNSGPNLTTMNSSQGWPDWTWPKDVILDNP